ncbi:MAG: threonine--tRNA ligase, partial [Patescibacteria group bacterium]
RTVMAIEPAIKQAKKEGQIYKEELLRDLRKDGETEVSFYRSGDFIDLCKGPHVKNVAEIGPFKLLSLAGAYWKGDEKKPMLTRIYGTCFPTQKELDDFLWQQEEAKKRDHKKLGRELELFLFSPSVGPGFPLYLPRGAILRRVLAQWITTEKEKRGYQFVWTPHVAKSDLYKQSRHWQKYDAMMNPMQLEDEEYVVKPMNCPHHFQIYLERPRSYRELPLRIAENATVYRYEKTGELNGLLRVRALTQDDTHTFVRYSQIPDEIDRILDLAISVFATFGFSAVVARISTHDPKTPEKYLGEEAIWKKAEAALLAAVKKRGLNYFVGEGEAAFYGPKIDLMVKDALSREWQLTTVQLDFNQPENFDMTYINEKGQPERPAVLHIAILGSFERFLAILIEHYGGAFPTWLSPVQVVVLPITDRQNEASVKVAEKLKEASIRVEVDTRNEPLSGKIRDHTLQKVPYLVIIGHKEVESGKISLRERSGREIKDISLEHFIQRLKEEIERKT